MVAILSAELKFPPATAASRDGLVAVGGDLSVERLLLAYENGIFPWPVCDESLMTWFSPDPRSILELDHFHASHSLKKLARQDYFQVTINQSFEEVIEGCAEPADGRASTWITPQMKRAYIELHRRGYAHSVEVRRLGKVVGGLYGVAIKGLFAGESMFSRESNASKFALLHLVKRLEARQFVLLDTQTRTPHLKRLGVTEISRSAYLQRLKTALSVERSFV